MDRILICLVSALDFRRINPEHTPFLFESLKLYPWALINTIPDNDLNPTLFTGVYPNDHGFWQLQLRNNISAHPKYKFIDKVPDIVTTTVQCLIHLFKSSFDLPAIPFWRRRRFEIYKTKHIPKNVKEFLTINDKETIFSIVGEKESKYIYSSKLDALYSLLPKVCSTKHRFELLEIHPLDLLQHWYLDNPDRIGKFYYKVDEFVSELHRKCGEKGITLMILSDHGQEPIRGSIDITKILKSQNISKYDYTYYIEAAKARFWFNSDRARKLILDKLSSIENGILLYYKDLHKYNINFEDECYGEYYFYANPSYILFPNDFHHPLGNLYIGLTDSHQRRRLLSPKFRGNHGYLPNYESEKGLMILLDDHYKIKQHEIDIVDFAPSLLGLLGLKKPDFMVGQNVFE